MRSVQVVSLSLALAAVVAAPAVAVEAPSVRPLNGSGNNSEHWDWGMASTPYLRVAKPFYANGVGQPLPGPAVRYVSNRIFNDTSQNLFSENGITQWGFAWGQFLDHTFGLRQDNGEDVPLAFRKSDPLEGFRNDLDHISFKRTPAMRGTGSTNPRQQVNTVSSFIDASNVYGDDDKARLEWLRAGPVDGNLANNSARLFLPGGYLPRADARPGRTPVMNMFGAMQARSARAMVAGDVRANENIALTATHTLFVREHNRIVDELPATLPEEEKFQIARRAVGALMQYITYTEFLPALGVKLSPYSGYDSETHPQLANEFAVVGYRVHSMIHGELEPSAPVGTYTDAQLAAFRKQGIEVETASGEVTLVVPLNKAFGNPDLLQAAGLDPVLKALGSERQYKNDEQMDNQLRSVLFQVPKPGTRDPSKCMDGPLLPQCFAGVSDLGALDIERGRDHGMPLYNDMRRAYGLAPAKSFTDITGEDTESFPRDPALNPGAPVDDPDSLDFLKLFDAEGKSIKPGTPEADAEAVNGIRRTALAARLKAVYGSPDKVDSFVGMVSEPHVQGTEFGELQLAMWEKQFTALRAGDRFFYLNDSDLESIADKYGITYQHTLAEVIERNTDLKVQPDVFKLEQK